MSLPLWFPVHNFKQNCQSVLFNFMFFLRKQKTAQSSLPHTVCKKSCIIQYGIFFVNHYFHNSDKNCRCGCSTKLGVTRKCIRNCVAKCVSVPLFTNLFILIINQIDAQNLFYNKFISCLYTFRAPCAHRQEVKIVLYSLWYHHTYQRLYNTILTSWR